MRELVADRAIDFWAHDQRVEVETLALQIRRHPGKTLAKLRLRPVGCEWLLARWRFLSRTNPTEWNDDQRALAVSLTDGDPSLDPSEPRFAVRMVAALEARQGRVEQADEVARGLVEADLSDDSPN